MTRVPGYLYKVAAHLLHATFNESLRRPLKWLRVQGLRKKVTLNAVPDGVLRIVCVHDLTERKKFEESLRY